MEPKFQSSFIPKAPVFTSNGRGESSGGVSTKSIFGLIATIIFVLAIVASVGVFAYDRYLVSNIGKMGKDLETARATLEPDTIKQLSRLNSRLVSTKEILDNHTVLSPFFDFLQNSTIKGLRFTDFSFGTDSKNNLVISMKGEAKNYASVALQSDLFNKSKYIKNAVFSDLDLDQKSNVIFSFKANVDPSLFSYKKLLEGTTNTSDSAVNIEQINNSSFSTTTATSTTN